MGLVGLQERVQLAAAPAESMHTAAMGLLAVLAVLSFCVASFRTMLRTLRLGLAATSI